MLVSRPARPELRPFVRLLWAGPAAAGAAARGWREHVLPTACMHLALRLSGPPLRLYEGPGDNEGVALGHAVVGGARTAFYVREAGRAGFTVGAQLEPGAAAALLGASAADLAGRHTLLPDLWPRQAGLLLERLQEAGEPARCIALLEEELLRRLDLARLPHPAVRAASALLCRGFTVHEAVLASGISHRHLVALFRHATGLAPKQFGRLVRLQHALRALGEPGISGAQVAAVAGYADQAHFHRDFLRFAGLTPGQWQRVRPAHPHHLPAPAPR